mmetsp:Transcript_7267/g.22146  ORF Transcript_7267/g.22146 Transcript_7267/m.22146 type:complete len:128 (-) Transcript_7267:407-790(-)
MLWIDVSQSRAGVAARHELGRSEEHRVAVSDVDGGRLASRSLRVDEGPKQFLCPLPIELAVFLPLFVLELPLPEPLEPVLLALLLPPLQLHLVVLFTLLHVCFDQLHEGFGRLGRESEQVDAPLDGR